MTLHVKLSLAAHYFVLGVLAARSGRSEGVYWFSYFVAQLVITFGKVGE